MSKTRAGWLFSLLSLCPIAISAWAGPHSVAPQIILRSYPMASALEVPTVTQIGISGTRAFVLSQATLIVTGSHSGVHPGTTHLSADGTTIIFRPTSPFGLNECVQVVLESGTGESGSGESESILDSFSFQTVRQNLDYSVIRNSESNGAAAARPIKSSGDNVLDLWPGISSNVATSPTPGRIFLSFDGPLPICGLVILSETGALEAFTAVLGSDFELQPNGQMTYFNGRGTYFAVDSSFTILDSFHCANGYVDDGHEFILQKDGSYTILGVTLTTSDLSSVGGSAAAQIQGNVIQTFDREGNLVFEWRGIDHYSVTDCQGISFTAQPVDFEHANAIDTDADGNYLLSNRHLSEVTKINGATGAMIWRFGGKENQFRTLNDTIGISYQHCARFLPMNHILLFNNGNLHAVPESRAVEYALDTARMTDSLVWQFRHDPAVFTSACGSVQRFANGNTFIGWGIQNPSPNGPGPSEGTTEVTANGTVLSDFSFGALLFSYRAQLVPEASASVNQAAGSPPSGSTLTVSQSNGGFDYSFSTPASTKVTLALYNQLGTKVAEEFDGMSSSSIRTIHDPAPGVASGIYYAVLTTPAGTLTRAVSLAR